jgi:replication factor A1
MKLDCTLFGPYVDELDAYLKSGNPDNVVLLAQFLKVKLYNGKIQMQNAMNCTKLLFNPNIPEADSLKLK